SDGTLMVCFRSGQDATSVPTSATAASTANSSSVVRQPNAAAMKPPAGRPTAIASDMLNMMIEIARPWRSGGCSATAAAAQVGATIATARPQQQRASIITPRLVVSAANRQPATNSASPAPSVVRNDQRDVAIASGMMATA